MATGIYRCTMFFTSQAYRLGWSETYFVGADGYASAGATMLALVPLRAALMMNTAIIEEIRVCNVNPPRDSFIYEVDPATGTGTYDAATKPSAGTFDALLIRLDDSVNMNCFNKRFLHFVPAEIFSGRNYLGASAPAPWPVNILAYSAYLIAGANQFLVRKTDPETHVTSYIALSIFVAKRRVERHLGRPFDTLVGRRRIA
jgi:hypothetical protein